MITSALAAIAVSLILLGFNVAPAAKGGTAFDSGEIRVAVIDQLDVQRMANEEPDRFNKIVTINDSLFTKVPKFKEVLVRALDNVDNVPDLGRAYSVSLPKAELNLIAAEIGSPNISQYMNQIQRDSLTGQDVVIEAYAAIVSHNGIYYNISWTKLSLL